jgi:RNA polymerase sigma factor (sigma-70 family)
MDADQSAKQRAQNLLDSGIRVFYHPSFDDPKERKNILAEMPGQEKFAKEISKISELRDTNTSPEMRPCYEAPLLDFEQEQHLFRKMNYFKYRAKRLMSDMNTSRVAENKVKNIENHLLVASTIRNQIAESNFRLATQLLKGQLNFYREHSLVETLLSDAYMDVLKSVDYFDWTKGYKFSTYTTWVIRKNFFRESKQKVALSEKFTHLDEAYAESLNSRGSDYEDEKKYEDQKSLVVKLLSLLANDKNVSDGPRQARVLEKYFGVNGYQKQTLEQISVEFNVTKERIRQVKEKGLGWIQNKVKELNIDYETEI